MYDPRYPGSGYDLPAPIEPPQAQHDFGATSQAYEQDVIETLRAQGVIDDSQASALMQGLGSLGAAFTQPAQQAPPPPVEETIPWPEATLMVGGAFAGGLIVARVLSRFF